MSKKIKTLISVLIVALLLTVGTTATVMAEEAEDSTPPETSENSLLERVADILGIDEDTLIDAFDQARQEMMGDTFGEWWGQKPEVTEPGMSKQRNLRFRTLPRVHMRNGPRAWFCPGLPGEAD